MVAGRVEWLRQGGIWVMVAAARWGNKVGIISELCLEMIPAARSKTHIYRHLKP